jgi:hypothetical protein
LGAVFINASGIDATPLTKDEGKTSTDNKRAYQLYVQHWNAAKNNPALQKQLTDRAREMGIVK